MKMKVILTLILTAMVFSLIAEGKGQLKIKSNYESGLTMYLDTEMIKISDEGVYEVSEGVHRIKIKKRNGEILYENENEIFEEGDILDIDFQNIPKTDFALKSMLLPGFGQFSNKRYLAGTTYSLLFAGSIGWAVFNYLDHQTNLDDYDSYEKSYKEAVNYADKVKYAKLANSVKSDAETSRDMLMISISTVGAIYLANIFDAMMLSNEDNIFVNKSKGGISMKPTIYCKNDHIFTGLTLTF
ncbi:MAG: hypothetical protein JXR48_16340 [Candidatus Delongbacteria bacterium]|nr:hypothetical protein [Candidatus Delongbacteria bacterium]MBN2836527.1 hypothetical protein [Candidatus Delongbacteria bacterium]